MLTVPSFAHRKSNGFTLIELIIVIVLIAILGLIGASMLSDSFSTSRRVDAYNASAVEARYAMERLVREIREVKHIEVAGAGRYCLAVPPTLPSAIVSPFTITSTPTALTFNKMAAASTNLSSCDTESTVVTICPSGTDLTLGSSTTCPVASPSNTLVTHAALTFKLFQDKCLTPATTTATVKFVEINLIVTDPTSNRPTTQRACVNLRNG